MSHKILICIIPRGESEIITKAAVQGGAGGGSVIFGRGTAQNSIIQLLGLGDSSKELIFTVVEESKYESVKNSIIQRTSECKKNYGVAFSLNVNKFIKLGTNSNQNDQESKMDTAVDYQLINIIVNKGYAEDAMAVARKAGAGGGTIIAARGTAKENDPQFFGMKIVPEKEMLMILVPSEKKQAILDAVNQMECFKEPGSGIVFCNDAHDFTLLGKNQ